MQQLLKYIVRYFSDGLENHNKEVKLTHIIVNSLIKNSVQFFLSAKLPINGPAKATNNPVIPIAPSPIRLS